MSDHRVADHEESRRRTADTIMNGSGRHDGHDGVTAAVLDVADPLVVVRRIAAQALVLIPAADGAVVELAGGDTLSYVCAAGTLFGSVGTRLSHAGSLSGLAMRCGQVQVCTNTATDPRVDRAACQRLRIVSMVCMPLVRGGAIVGVLKLSSQRPDAFDPAAVALLERLAGFIAAAIACWSEMAVSAAAAMAISVSPTTARRSTVFGAQTHCGVPTDSTHDTGARERVSMFVANVMSPGMADENETRRRVRRLLDGAGPVMHLQPIIDLKTGRVAGCEALARFPDRGGRSPQAWFADAERAGLGPELELAAIRAALEHLPRLPQSTYLAVNVGHELAASPVLHDLIAHADGARIVVELTEHLQVDDYPTLIRALDALRTAGARLAIDDTGAGFAGFSHILKLAPDLIKLDRILTTGIDTDLARQALAGALVNFACATGAKVIAEGIETAAELGVVHRLGIDYGQGYHLARPASLATTLDRITGATRRPRSVATAGPDERLHLAKRLGAAR